MFRSKLFGLVIAIFFSILAACGPSADQTSAPVSFAASSPQVVSAAGVVIPEREATLSATTGGIIEDVLVDQGEQVSSGELLVKLQGSEAQQAAVSAAETELLNAKIALDALNEDTDLLAAEALNSAEAAEQALEDLNNPDLAQAQALQAVADAEKALSDADRNLAILTNPPAQNTLDEARGNILLAEKKMKETHEQIEDLEWQFKKFSSDQNLPAEFKKGILAKIRQALKGIELKRSQEQLALDNLRTRYSELLEPPDAVDVQLAEANLAAAQALLNHAQKELNRVRSGPQAGEVALLEAKIERGRRDYEIYGAGPDPQDVSLAKARLVNAEAQLAAANAAITDRELLAPYDGVITELYVNPGEWVAPGSPVVRVGNLDQLQVETTDLNEIEVARIAVGNPATITFDALPGVVLQGTVSQIAPKPADGPGVNYPVIIELNQIPAELRWGMTASVGFTRE